MYFSKKALLRLKKFIKSGIAFWQGLIGKGRSNLPMCFWEKSCPPNPSVYLREKNSPCIRIVSRSSHLELFYKKGVLKFHKNICGSVFLCIKLQAFVYSFLKKRPQHRCFPVSFVKFLRTTMLHKICQRLRYFSLSINVTYRSTL